MKCHEPDEKGQHEILVVDDSHTSRKLLKSLLEGHGYQVRPASDGYLTLKTVAVKIPDLILLDVKMPDLDGYEICRRLKSEKATRDVPVIFISALGETTDKVQGFEAGGVDFITKPFEPEEVLARVGTHLQLRELTERLEKKVRERTRELESANQQLRQEIVERKLAEEALRESEQKLASIIDFYPDATFVINKKGEVISWNKKIEAMTGVPADDIIGKGNYEYALPFYGERRPILINLALKRNEEIERKYGYFNREGQLLIGEVYDVNLRGKEYHLMATCAPLYDSRGNISGAIESIRDITKRKKALDALQRAHDELEAKVMERTAKLTAAMEQARQASRAKSDFLANISHELRTPLNAIIGYAYMLTRSENLTDDEIQQIRTIRTSGEHLQNLIDDILDLSQIEAGKMEMVQKPFNLKRLINGAMNTTRIRAEQKGLFLNFEAEGLDVPTVMGDERKLRQVLLNLMDNAVKYTEQGGVTLRVSADDDPSFDENHSSQVAKNGALPRGDTRAPAFCFEIEDTGIGIGKKEIITIFEPFHQGLRKEKALGGIGLGLAISRKMVELMGGTLSVESTLGMGSRFTVRIPLHTAEPADVPEKPLEDRAIGYTGERRRVLIVDDDITNISFLVSLLDPLDFAIAVAQDGFEALIKAEKSIPDLILLDLLMPKIDGIEVMQRIRSDERLSAINVIGISAAVADKARVETFAAMCDAFIPVPVNPTRLLSELEYQLQLRWIENGNDNLTATPAMDRETPINMPPRTVLGEILKRVERGEVSRLERLVSELEKEDEDYTDFCGRIKKYLDDFDETSLIRLLSKRGDMDG